MTKLLKSNKGFTLVEVIVVAVIVLILAAVAIPLYNGYMRDSRQAVAESTAGAIASALSAVAQSNLITTAAGITTAYVTWGEAPTAETDKARQIIRMHTKGLLTSDDDEDNINITTILVPAGYAAKFGTEGCVEVQWMKEDAELIAYSAWSAAGADGCESDD